MTRRPFRPAFAVVRYDGNSVSDDPTLRWTVVGIYLDHLAAHKKCDELNAIKRNPQTTYFVQQTRLKQTLDEREDRDDS